MSPANSRICAYLFLSRKGAKRAKVFILSTDYTKQNFLVILVIRGDQQTLRMAICFIREITLIKISGVSRGPRVSVGQKIPRDPRDPWSKKTHHRGISN